jgi:ABC-type branched-subunit amino acid transport system ATPase component/ABC-type branched-subunit amino acid transport system permease subunit
MLGLTLTRQVVFDGLMSGLVFGLLALGIVLVYRATRVINFAVGNMGLIGAGLLVLIVVQYGVPYWLSVAAALVVGTVYGALLELTVIRRLFDAPRVIVLVATIGIAQLSLAILTAYPDIDQPGARFPQAFGSAHELASVQITGAQLSILVVVPVVALTLGWFLTRTTFGKSVKASAENRDLARLNGISPKLVSLFVWAAAGALATLSLCLMAGQSGSATDLVTLGPSTLVRALAAAVIGGMVSFRRAFTAGIAIGILEAVVRFNYLDQPGLVDFLLLLGILVAVYFQSRSDSTETQSFAFTPKRRPIPARLRDVWWVRNLDRAALGVLGIGAVVLPLVVTEPSRHLLYTTILVFALCGLSLTMLTGWAGQLSLGQMAFAGLGAFMAAALHRGITIDIGWGSTRVVDAGLKPLAAGPSILLAAIATACIAAIIGLGALRVRGLLLAVSTFAFGLAAAQYLYHRPILNAGFGGSVPFERTDLFGLDVRDQRTYYYVVLGVTIVAVIVVAHLRNSGVGRAIIAVRDNSACAAAYTVTPSRVKLRTFAMAGGLAGLAGALLAGSLQNIPTDRFFGVDDSLLLVSIVVIGGLGSVAGPILGAIWVIGLPAFFPGNDLVPLLTSSIGLLFLLLYFPGGIIQLAYFARDAVLDVADRRAPSAPEKTRAGLRPRAAAKPRAALAAELPVLQTSNVSVRFGGNVAVDDVCIEVRANDIVGLIGTNGAGKSTLMNAIGGYVRSSGSIDLLGHDVSKKSPAARARRGLGRTFQAATLFPELTVRETVEVALEAQYRTGFVSTALSIPPSMRVERARRAAASEVIDFLGLGRYADVHIADLSTGTRRVVELAGLLAVDATVLCLDEPTAGLAQREAEAFGPVIVNVQRELSASVLVIEHDMPLIMGISDRVYCLDAGRIIAAGPPGAVRNDPAVIAAYLGTDERSIARSGAAAPTGRAPIAR